MNPLQNAATKMLLDEQYTLPFLQNEKWISLFQKRGLILDDLNNTVGTFINLEIFHDLFSLGDQSHFQELSANFRRETLLSMLYILHMIQKYKIGLKIPLRDLCESRHPMIGYRMWRFFFSTLVLQNKWDRETLSFLMFSVDRAFHFEEHYEQNIYLTIVLEFIFFIKKFNISMAKIFAFLKKQEIVELKQSILLLEEFKIKIFDEIHKNACRDPKSLLINTYMEKVLREWDGHVTNHAINVLNARFRNAGKNIWDQLHAWGMCEYMQKEEKKMVAPKFIHNYCYDEQYGVLV